MLADEELLCKCHKPVTRHCSRAQRSYGAFYYKCYKGFTPGCCDFFEWEQLPSSPPSPVMSPTRRDGNQEPTTPPRKRTASAYSAGSPAVDTPRRKAIADALQKSFADDERRETEESRRRDGNTSSTSTTPMMKRTAVSTMAIHQTTSSSESPTRSSSFSQGGERALVRAATEGDLGGQWSREELLKLLEIRQSQLEAERDTVKALQKQLGAVRAERDFFGPDTSPLSLNLPSPSKGKGKALDFSSPPRVHHQSIVVPAPTPESSATTVQSHFSVRSPAKSTSGGRPVMWN